MVNNNICLVFWETRLILSSVIKSLRIESFAMIDSRAWCLKSKLMITRCLLVLNEKMAVQCC